MINLGRDRAVPRRIRFAPPTEIFTLCHYTVSRVKKLPITGSFEMFVSSTRYWSAHETLVLTINLEIFAEVLFS